VAREGGVSRACEHLHVTQPAVSAQLRKLERALGERLFERHGRGIALTDAGRLAYQYADEIFSMGRELTDVMAGRPSGQAMRLVVGVADVLPKLLTYRLLEPALKLAQPVRLVLHEDSTEHLLAALSAHEVDLVLSDAPLPPTVAVRAFNHFLGECGVTVFATKDQAPRYTDRFPRSMDGAPFLLPNLGSTLRRSLDHWFEEAGIRPMIVGEIEDSALLKVFGQAGVGLFVAPSAVESEVRRRYRVQVVGRIESVRESVYAISVERRIKHPAILAITTAARAGLLASAPAAMKHTGGAKPKGSKAGPRERKTVRS